MVAPDLIVRQAFRTELVKETTDIRIESVESHQRTVGLHLVIHSDTV